MKVRLQGKDIATKCAVADSAIARMIGLLRHDSLNSGEGMLFRPANSVHTFFMKFTIDVAFLDEKDRVVAVKHEMKPWKMSRIYFAAKSMLEVPGGTLKANAVRVGDQLEITPA